MPQGETNRTALYWSAETDWAETPSSPTMTEIPFTGETLRANKNTVQSEVIRADRMRDDIVNVGNGAEGDVNFELRFADFDDLMESFMAAAFVTATISRTDMSAATTDDSFNTAAGNFLTAGFVVGMWIRVGGFLASADNNGLFKIAAVTATKITIDALLSQNLVVEAADELVTISAKMVRNGILKNSILLEKRFLDIVQFATYEGFRLGQLNVNVTAEELVSGSFSGMGEREVLAGSSVSGSDVASSANNSMSASVDVGSVVQGSTILTTALRSVQFSANNNLRMLRAIANQFPTQINYGTFEVTGTIEAYFEDLLLYNQFTAHTSALLSFILTDNEDQSIIFTFPSVFFLSAPLPIPGENQDIIASIEFSAVRDPDTDTLMQIDFLDNFTGLGPIIITEAVTITETVTIVFA